MVKLVQFQVAVRDFKAYFFEKKIKRYVPAHAYRINDDSKKALMVLPT